MERQRRAAEGAAVPVPVTASTGALGPVLAKLNALLGDGRNELVERRREAGDIKSIRSELEAVYPVLMRLQDDDDGEDWMAEARELIYDIDDKVEDFVLDLESPEAVSNGGAFTQPTSAFHGLKIKLKEATKRCRRRLETLEAVSSRRKTAVVDDDPRARFIHKDASELVGVDKQRTRVMELLALLPAPAGAEEDDVQRMMLRMVCIVGFAGMGKTTLADLVYQAVAEQFRCSAFASLSGASLGTVNFLKSILGQLTGATSIQYPAGTSTEKAATEQHLVACVSNVLADKRYLVVVDDICHYWKEWDIIRRAFPENHMGSRIILTTRIYAVAQECCNDALIHKLPGINYYDAIKLSEAVILKQSDTRDILAVNLEELCGNIEFMSRGIPLALHCLSAAAADIIVEGNYDGWDTWMQHIQDGFLSIRFLKPLAASLCLLYNNLPVHLKTCLLYCTTYPDFLSERVLTKVQEIERHDLVRKWVAEGFVSQLEAAEAYFDDLVSRDLLSAHQTHTHGEQRWFYQMHPLMLPFLVCKSKEANFVSRWPHDCGSAKRIRRLVAHHSHSNIFRKRHSYSDYFKTYHAYPPQYDSGIDEPLSHLLGRDASFPHHSYRSPNSPQHSGIDEPLSRLRGLDASFARHSSSSSSSGSGIDEPLSRLLGRDASPFSRIRSLAVSFRCQGAGFNQCGWNWSAIPSFKEMEHLRVLDLEQINEIDNGDLVYICRALVCLRYLGLKGCRTITVLPRKIGRLKNLETLDVSGTRVKDLPMEIGELGHLETLNVSDTMIREIPREIVKLQHLKTLNVSNTGVIELPWECNKLSNSVRVLAGDKSCPQLVKLPDGLRAVWLAQEKGAITSSSRAMTTCRQDLSIMLFDHFGLSSGPLPVAGLKAASRHTSIPPWVKEHLSDVSSLDLRLCRLEEEEGDLKFLRQMPNLKVLALRFEILPRKPITITAAGFSKLESFLVDCRLPLVTFRQGAMPNLKHLEFKFYTGRASVDPMGITNLKSIQKVVFWCSKHYRSDSAGIAAMLRVVRQEAEELRKRISLWINGEEEVFLEKKGAEACEKDIINGGRGSGECVVKTRLPGSNAKGKAIHVTNYASSSRETKIHEIEESQE